MSLQTRVDVRSADGTLIPIFKSGQGRPLVMVHGGTGDHSNWDGVRPYLETSWTVVAIDRRNGLVEPEVRYSLEREFEDVAAVIESLDEDVDLLGSSSGALCALGASLISSRIQRLVLYEPPLVAGNPTNPELARLVKAGELERATEFHLKELLKQSPEAIAARKASPRWSRSVARIPYFVREEAVVQAWEPDLQALSRMKTPTLLLVGGNTPVGHQHRGYIGLLQSAGANLTVAEIPGQEHFAHTEVPEVFAHLVREILEDELRANGVVGRRPFPDQGSH